MKRSIILTTIFNRINLLLAILTISISIVALFGALLFGAVHQLITAVLAGALSYVLFYNVKTKK